MGNEYKITDLYITAYLKALGYSCKTTFINKRCYFIFPEDAKAKVAEYVQNGDKQTCNVNASLLVNEIKQLKAFVNNS